MTSLLLEIFTYKWLTNSDVHSAISLPYVVIKIENFGVICENCLANRTMTHDSKIRLHKLTQYAVVSIPLYTD